MLVVALLGVLFIREPHVQHWDDGFLRWLLEHSPPATPAVALTVVELGVDSLDDKPGETAAAAVKPAKSQTRNAAISPLEFALFLQSIMEFHPDVIAFENILKWRDRDKDQEQVFLDQAMRVPKLLLAAELTGTPDPDAPGPEIHGFTQVKGRRGDLMEFSGLGRQPNEDMRLISTLGFANLPDEVSSDLRVPLLFLYRGEVIPSFALQAILLWLRVSPAEVKVVIGSHIVLPDGRRIPIGPDGAMLIHPYAAKTTRRISLNELLLEAQQRESGSKGKGEMTDLHQQIVLARTPANPLSPPDVFVSAIATIQANACIRRISQVFDFVILAVVVACVPYVRRFDRADLILCGIAFTAGYCLLAITLISKWHLWLPGLLPLGAMWILVLSSVILRNAFEPSRGATVAIGPPLT